MSSESHDYRCKRSAPVVPKEQYACKPVFSISMLDILERGNMFQALKRVQDNKGCPGIDGMTVTELPEYLRTRWLEIRKTILNGTYIPKPVKAIHIPKPQGGQRMLGIPTVSDRLIQQAILQKLAPLFDEGFSTHSFGFRSGRNAHQALQQALGFQKQGYVFTVDIDLEKFFDTVNHDRLMSRLAESVKDKKLLLLLRRYLQTGMMSDGVCITRDRGTPQGSPLSPLLSNIVLDELDKELEYRGHKFCRYADDCNIYVRSKASGERVYASVKRFIERTLRLTVNTDKSAVDFSWRRSFLGYSFIGVKNPQLRMQ